jgi:4-carboxymuconolactone decarboxylase
MRMKELKPVPVDEWNGSLKKILEDMKGIPLNIHSLMAHNPELLQAWWAFRNYSVKGGHLGQRKAELVILRVAVRLGSWYEWAAHIERSLQIGISLDLIEEIRKNSPEMPEEDAILIQAVDDLILDKRLSPETLEQASHYYDKRQLLDIIAIHGMYVTLGCMIETWGVELDRHVREALPASLNEKNFAPHIQE